MMTKMPLFTWGGTPQVCITVLFFKTDLNKCECIPYVFSQKVCDDQPVDSLYNPTLLTRTSSEMYMV